MKTYLTSLTTTVAYAATSFLLFVAETAAQSSNPSPSATQLQNPISVDSISGLLLAILNIIVIVMIPIVIFFIVYAGFLFVTAQGNAEQVQNAKRALLYALIGGVLIIGAEAITAIIEQVVADFQ